MGQKGKLLDEILILATVRSLLVVVVCLSSISEVNPNVFSSAGETPLMAAAQFSDVPIMIALLAHRDIDPNLCNKGGDTALRLAFEFGKVDAINLLVQWEDVDINIPDGSMITSLMRAAMTLYDPNGDWMEGDTVGLILSRKDVKVNMVDTFGRTDRKSVV